MSSYLEAAAHAVDDAAHAAADAADEAVHAAADAAADAAHVTGIDEAVNAVADAAGEAAHVTGLDVAVHMVADTAGAAVGTMGSGAIATEETAEAAALAAEEAAEATADAAYELIWDKKKDEPTNGEADDDAKLDGKLEAARARAHFHAGSAFELQGRWVGAEREFRRAARLDPRHPSAAERHAHAEARRVPSVSAPPRAECCHCTRPLAPRRSIDRPQAQLEGARRAAAADALALSERVAEATSGEPMALRSARAVLAAHCVDEATINTRRDHAVGGARALDEAVLLGEVGGAARVWCRAVPSEDTAGHNSKRTRLDIACTCFFFLHARPSRGAAWDMGGRCMVKMKRESITMGESTNVRRVLGELDLVRALLALGAHADARRGGAGGNDVRGKGGKGRVVGGDGTSALHWFVPSRFEGFEGGRAWRRRENGAPNVATKNEKATNAKRKENTARTQSANDREH